MEDVFPAVPSQQDVNNIKKYALKFLTANTNKSIAGVSSPSSTFTCTVYKQISNSLKPYSSLLYSIVPGSTFTKQFYILEGHQYIQIKFNAAVVQLDQVIIDIELQNGGGTTLLSVRQSSQASNDTSLSIQCVENSTVFGLFYVTKSLSTTQQNFTLQVKSLDANDIYGVSNFQIYYGSCNKKCKTCSGPTESQCLSCQGLYMQLANGTCQTCPSGHYDNGYLCRLCPKNCKTCTFNSQTKQLICTSCLPWSPLTQGKCTPLYEEFSLPQQLLYNSSQDWKSSQTLLQPLTVCGQYSLIGGISIGHQGSTLSKTFTNLSVHQEVNIYMVFWMIDQQPDDTNLYQILVDGIVISQKQVSITPSQSNWTLSNQCGNSNPQIQFIVSLESIPHQGSNITISITSIKNWFGFRDFTLIVSNKTSVLNCYQQTNGVCTSCQKGFKYDTQKKTCNQCSDGYYLTKSKDSCEICPIQCKTCQLQLGFNKIICLSCTSPLELNSGTCKDTSGAVYGRDIIPNGIQPLSQNTWALYPKLPQHGITKCGNKSILGSNQIRHKFLQMTKQYNNLPSHQGVKIYFNFYQIDNYTNNSVFFVLNGKQYPYAPTLERKQICGDTNVPDAVVKLQYLDTQHTDSTLLFEIHAVGKIKLGVNNVILFLLNCNGCNNVVPFDIESIPVYSLTTPPTKGVEVKVMFNEGINNSTTFSSAVQFSITNPNQQVSPQTNSSRLMQGLIQFNDNLPIAWEQTVSNRQYRSFLQLSQDYTGNQITVDPVNFWALSSDPNSNGAVKLLSSIPVTKNMPRYIDIDENSTDNRTNMRNLRNLFQGCAIFALWFGLASFIFGFSCAFDDFFILVQVIFAHIFIQLPYSPPSLRVPLQGMQIVQFMAWLPWQARVSIQNGIIANNLYQRSPIVYEQYYQDIVYARTIYHTILFFVFMIVLYILLLTLTHMLASSPQSKRKYADSYLVKYFSDYENYKFAYIDKFVRFAFFTVIWACTLQFTVFSNSPREFNIWNSVLCIVMFVIFVLYPIGGFFWLRKMSGEMSDSTFRKKYQDVRINPNRLFHFIWRYYKLLVIALLIGLLYDSNPVAILIPLILLHIADGLIILFLKPFGMEQQQQLNVCLYNHYPKIYEISSLIQSFLFAFLELFILITYAVRNTANDYSYLGLGYFCCAIIVVLLLNGLIRLVWGFIKIVEGCFAKSKEMKLLVENKALKQKETNEELMPMKSIKQLQSNLNILQSKSRLNTIRKTTLVSKIS